MTNLTPIGNEADILRESKMPSQVEPRRVSSSVAPVTSTQAVSDMAEVAIPPAKNEIPVVPNALVSEMPNSSSVDLDSGLGSAASLDDSSLKPYSEPVHAVAKTDFPQPIKQSGYKPFSYKLPVLNYVLSIIFFIISAVSLVYYIQVLSGSLTNAPIVDGAIYGIQVIGFSVGSVSTNFGAIAGHFTIATALLLALTLLTSTRMILYVSVFASLFGTAYWGYALSFAVSKASLGEVIGGVGIYVLLFYLFMFSIMLTTFIHTVKSSIRT